MSTNVSKTYARALFDLGKSKNLNVVEELEKLNETINSSNALENVLFLQVFSQEEKLAVFQDIVSKLGLSPVVENFVKYLIGESRIGELPSIYKDLVVIDDNDRGFLRGEIMGADKELLPEIRKTLEGFITSKMGKAPKLDYVSSKSVTAGYRIRVGDTLLDATVDHQLDRFKEDVLAQTTK